ncbi:MAG: futalosine hydrolase [bacterium]|nr:futalosine hydrolase [bacterium]
MSGHTLLLIPTRLEESRLERLGGLRWDACETARIGFGPVAAAARCAGLIAERQPARVVLIGIAGTYDADALAPGTAAVFDEVALDGVGVGSEGGLLPPSQIGFPQWPGGDGTPADAVMESLPLAADSTAQTSAGLVLTVCAASADPVQAQRRRERWPSARAEDMEGFGAALACHLAGVPLSVVRGISNVAGDRDTSRWRIDEALDSARSRANVLLSRLAP